MDVHDDVAQAGRGASAFFLVTSSLLCSAAYLVRSPLACGAAGASIRSDGDGDGPGRSRMNEILRWTQEIMMDELGEQVLVVQVQPSVASAASPCKKKIHAKKS